MHGPAHRNSSDTSPIKGTDVYGRPIKWNISVYATDEKVNPNLSHQNRLKIVDKTNMGGSNLQIINISYICHSSNNGSINSVRFVLQQKMYPSNMTFINESKEHILNGIEHNTMRIICIVHSGKPPETLSLKRNNKTVKTGGHGNIEFTFKPTKLDHNFKYTCEAKNPLFKESLTRNIYTNIKYKPVISTANDRNDVNEGEKKNLCCYVDSNPVSITTRLVNGSHDVFVKHKVKHICFLIEEVSRYDHGNYTCIAENEIGSDSVTINLNVKYPPDVHLDNKNFSIDDEMRTIQCKSKGYPSNYTYGIWEHRSEFNEHIRYLNSTENGTLILPKINAVSYKYQDSGIYICMVTNGIPNKQHFQQGKAYVVYEGPPVFVYQNRAIQYGITGKKVNIKGYFLSYSKIECIAIRAIDGVVDVNYVQETYAKPLKVLDIFHGQIISVNGIEVDFVFARLEHKHFRMYRITVCNTFGNESYTLSLVPKADNSLEEENTISSERIVIVVLLILIMFLLVLVGLYVRYLKKRYRKRIITPTTGQRAESPHYMEITEDNNVLSTLQERDTQIITDARIVFENRNISRVSEEQHLVVSNNDSYTSEHTIGSSDNAINASEHLDDGYERPYTTLVAHNYENEHGYCSTITNSIDDNSTTLENATSFAYTEQDPSHDSQNTYFFADDGQVNVKRNTKEYINLSLKQ